MKYFATIQIQFELQDGTFQIVPVPYGEFKRVAEIPSHDDLTVFPVEKRFEMAKQCQPEEAAKPINFYMIYSKKGYVRQTREGLEVL